MQNLSGAGSGIWKWVECCVSVHECEIVSELVVIPWMLGLDVWFVCVGDHHAAADVVIWKIG